MIPRIGTGYLRKPRVFPRKQVSSGVEPAHNVEHQKRDGTRSLRAPAGADGTFSSPAVADTVTARRRETGGMTGGRT